MKSLFIWPGGKRKMLKYYRPLLPTSIEEYTEPFFGGGAMFIEVYTKYRPKRSYLNDINPGLMSIYKNIKENKKAFVGLLKEREEEYIPLTKEERKEYYYALRSEHAWEFEKWSDLQESAVLFFLMKTCFNGIWQINKNTNGRFGTPSGLLNQKHSVFDYENIDRWEEALQNTVLTNQDWRDVPFKGFTFCDPPYRGSFTSYGTSFSDKDFSDLVAKAKTCNLAWLCNRDIEDGFYESFDLPIHKFPVTYTAGRRKKTEDGFEAKKAVEVLLISDQ